MYRLRLWAIAFFFSLCAQRRPSSQDAKDEQTGGPDSSFLHCIPFGMRFRRVALPVKRASNPIQMMPPMN